MSTLDDLKQTFFEESAEGLEAIDQGLSDLHAGAGTDETVNAVFRAIHSIKGGAGVFGFESLVGFAHVFETVLDAIRHGRLAPDSAIVDVLLKANDTLTDIVAMSRAGEGPSAGFDAESRKALSDLLGADGNDEGGAVAPDFSGLDFVPVRAEDTAETPLPARTCRIAFRPREAPFDRQFLAIRDGLSLLGTLVLEPDATLLPELSALDPAQAYLGWTGTLETAAAATDIRDLFLAIDSSGAWEFTEPPDASADPPADFPEAVAPASPAETSESLRAIRADEAPLAPDIARREAPAAKPGAGTTIRVDLEKIDRIVNMVGELVISQTMLGQLFQELPGAAGGRLPQVLDDVFLHTRELKNSVMSMRAQPVRSVFQRMSRLVRELSVKTGKSIQLETAGEGTEVDKTVIERLSDPLTHIIRNAVDHGIEHPAERRAAGKAEEGRIRLLAEQRSSRIIIEISDDGAGIDPERVVRKARERQLISPDAQLGEDEISNLVFLPGFSTAETVSDISGRGVGMDVVRRNVQELGGRITLKSRRGRGMTIQLSLPLTLAVMDGMIVRVGAETYVMPIACIVECIRPSRADVRTLAGGYGALRIRGTAVPLLNLAELLDIAPLPDRSEADTTVIVIETSEGVRLGIVVDQLCGHQQVVIKSIEENYGAVPGVAGATILGDGHVAFILDAERLPDLALRFSGEPGATPGSQAGA